MVGVGCGLAAFGVIVLKFHFICPAADGCYQKSLRGLQRALATDGLHPPRSNAILHKIKLMKMSATGRTTNRRKWINNNVTINAEIKYE